MYTYHEGEKNQNQLFFVQKENLPKFLVLHISSNYAKILGEQLFRTWEFPRSGSKAKTGEEKKKEKERLNNGDNNGQATHGARKHAWRTQAAWANRFKRPNTTTHEPQIQYGSEYNDIGFREPGSQVRAFS